MDSKKEREHAQLYFDNWVAKFALLGSYVSIQLEKHEYFNVDLDWQYPAKRNQLKILSTCFFSVSVWRTEILRLLKFNHIQTKGGKIIDHTFFFLGICVSNYKRKGGGSHFSPTQSSPTFSWNEAEQLHWWYHPMWYGRLGECQENPKVDWDQCHSGRSPKFAEQWDSVLEKFHQQNQIHISILVLSKNHLYEDNESNT